MEAPRGEDTGGDENMECSCGDDASSDCGLTGYDGIVSGRSISSGDKRLMGGSVDDEPGRGSVGPGDTPDVLVRFCSSWKLDPSSPWLSRSCTKLLSGKSENWGAETILLPPAVLLKGLLLRRLPDRGILHVEGDGDGNISPMEKERLELNSGSV